MKKIITHIATAYLNKMDLIELKSTDNIYINRMIR